MISLIAMQRKLEDEISMSDQCLVNLLERLDEDIARINERKLQLMDEFAARRNNLEQLIGTETEVDEEVHPDA
jgi:glucose-6-phosphate-specific signal transduction histidine kinase